MSQNIHENAKKAVSRHRNAINPHLSHKQKLTAERIADLQQTYDVMRKLWRVGCLVNHYYSTDTNPVIMVEPCQKFKRFIVGKVVQIDQRIKVGSLVQVFQHVEVKGVWVEWASLETKSKIKEQ